LQRRATIDPLSILCPSRGGSTSPERHLDSSFPLQLEPAASSSVGQLVTAPLHSAGCGRSRDAHRTHSSPIAPLLVCGAGATCGVADGWGGLACTGGSTACDGGTLRWRAGATCGVAALGNGLASTEWLGRLRWRRVTLAEVRILRFAICDELQIDLWLRFVARRGCGVPRMTGAMQSRKRPSPALALPCTNPACSQAALISAQGPWRGAACTETAAPKPTINVPRMPPQNFTPGVRFQRLAQKVPPRDASLRLRRGLARPI
jgi:hypothetical protein